MTLPLDTFIAAVGSGNIVAIYDPSYLAPTMSGSRISSLSPGAGFGPAITPSGATSPTFPGGLSGMGFNAGDPDALSATNAAFAASGALTMFLFLSSAAGLTEFPCGLVARDMCCRVNASSNILHYDDSTGQIDSGVPLSGAPQVVTLSKSATTNRKIKVGSAAEVSGTLSALPGGAQTFCVGDYMPNSFGFTGTVWVAGFLSLQATSTTHVAINKYFTDLLFPSANNNGFFF